MDDAILYALGVRAIMRALFAALALGVCSCGPSAEQARMSAEQARISAEQRDQALIIGAVDTLETALDNANWALARSALSVNVVDNGVSVPADQLVDAWSNAHADGKSRSRSITQLSVAIIGETATVTQTGAIRYEMPSLTSAPSNYWQGTGTFEYALARSGDTWLVTGMSFAKASEEGDPRVVTHTPLQLQSAIFVSELTGTWRGTYCGNSRTTWTINTQPAESSWARERWCNPLTCGDLDFRLSGADARNRRLTALAYYGPGYSSTGFTVDFQVSADGTRLDGAFNGHPRCRTIHLTRSTTYVTRDPLSAQTPSSIYAAAAEPQRNTTAAIADGRAATEDYRAFVEREQHIQNGIDFRQQQQDWDN